MKQTDGLPTIILPYRGPTDDQNLQDIFVYLRPETNGLRVESIMLKVLKSAKKYSSTMKLVYMANFPGEFIAANNIIEQYYSLKLHFAVMGKSAFTPQMIRQFNTHFHHGFDDSEVLGAFQALGRFNMSPEELFNVWVAKDDICVINGQTIKKINNSYVVNYDIPELIHKNSNKTDIAIMLFRTSLDQSNLQELFKSMHAALIHANIINPRYDISRAFHYSKGPFEQLMDGIAYLYTQNREKIGLEDFTFARYLMERTIDSVLICGLLMNPIVGLEQTPGPILEVNLFQYTSGMNYGQTYATLQQIRYQTIIIHHGPLLQAICPGFAK